MHLVAIGVVLAFLQVHPLVQAAAFNQPVSRLTPIVPALTMPAALSPALTPIAPAPQPHAPGAAVATGPAPPPPSAQGVVGIIEAAFNPQGATAVSWALRVAKCESGYNPLATNPYSGAAGLFQFLPSTWARTPYAAQSIYSAQANAAAAAWLYRQDLGAAWSCK